MFERVRLNRFRCFRKLDVPLRKLTVLIGPNDSGKSAFLDALRIVTGALAVQPQDLWRQELGELNIEAEPPRNTITLIGQTGGFKPGGHCVSPAAAYVNLPSSGIVLQSVGTPDSAGAPLPGTTGENTAALVDYLLRRDRKRFSSFVDTLKDLVPGLEDVAIATPDPSVRRIDLITEHGLRAPADRLSAGVRLLIFFVALAHHPEPPELLLVEEPESGVHPKRLADVMTLLRQITDGLGGARPAQIVISTHSPYLLDCVDPSKDQVLVFSRQDDGGRTAEPVDSDRLKRFLGEFMLGEIWFNEGEQGLTKRAS